MNTYELFVKKNRLAIKMECFIFLTMRTIKNVVAFFTMYIVSLALKKKVNDEPNEKERFLFVHLSLPLGDFLSRSLFLKNLEKLTSKYLIDVCIDSKYRTLVEVLGLKANFLFINSAKFKRNLIYRYSIHRAINENCYDNVVNISVDRGMVSDEVSILSKAKRLTTIRKYNKYLSKRIERINNDRYNEILDLGELNEYRKMEKLFLVLFGEKDYDLSRIEVINELRLPFSNYISINITASNEEKVWPIEKFKFLIRKLEGHNTIVLLGERNNAKFKSQLVMDSNSIIDLAGKTQLGELPHIIKKSKLFIGSDSGLLHLAFILGVPLIGITGCGALNVFFPNYLYKNQYYLFNEMDCFNCDWVCKYKESYCITRVNVADVYDLIQNLLKN